MLSNQHNKPSRYHLEKAHVCEAKRLNNNDKKLSPLLDMSTAEEAKIATMSVVGGFSVVSGAASWIETGIAAVSTITKIGTVGGLGVAGAAIGAYRAKKLIKAEQEKIIQLNKELFLLFNLAADKRQEQTKQEREYELATAKDSKTSPDEALRIKALFDTAEKKYFDLITQIQFAISNKMDQRKIICRETMNRDEENPGKITHTEEVLRMSAIIDEYVAHRDTLAGKKEKKLWELLLSKNIFNKNQELQECFLTCNSVSETTEYLQKQQEIHKEEYQKGFEQLRQYFAAIKRDDEKQQGYHQLITNDLPMLMDWLRNLYHFGDMYSKKLVERKKGQGAAFDFNEDLLTPLNEVYQRIIQTMKANGFNKKNIENIEKLWQSSFALNIKLIQEHFAQLSDTTAIRETTEQFGENGTFRQFWRALPNKTYGADAIPLNLEQNIYRGGSVNKLTMCALGAGVGVGLYSTAHGLYIAALALGAVAVGTMGIGLIAAAVALALTLVWLGCSYYAEKNKADRVNLGTSLASTRKTVFDKEAEISPNTLSPKASVAQQNMFIEQARRTKLSDVSIEDRSVSTTPLLADCKS